MFWYFLLDCLMLFGSDEQPLSNFSVVVFRREARNALLPRLIHKQTWSSLLAAVLSSYYSLEIGGVHLELKHDDDAG